MPNKTNAKAALDKLITKSRVHLYKPIQIAEILFKIRSGENISPLNIEDYRTKSKKWRDDVCKVLLGRTCTSSARFQDDLFNENAIPPTILAVLNDENLKTNGAVEAYIYKRFTSRHYQLAAALAYCNNANCYDFDVKRFIDSFWLEPGLKRSLDKIYEIIVYALFSTLTEALDLKVEISVAQNRFNILKEFEDFTQKVMCLDFETPSFL